MSKTPIALSLARNLAERIVTTLSPACERIEIAGSIRRGSSTVGDLEIVAIPAHGSGLFPQSNGPSRLVPLLDRLAREGRLTPGRCAGEK